MPEPARITFSRGAWAALAAFAALMLGSLVTQVLLIEDQRSTVDRQLATAVRQADAARPLIEQARPLVEEARPLVAEARPLLRRARRDAPVTQRLVRAATPLVEQLDATRAPEQLQAAGALARTLVRADVGAMVRVVIGAGALVEDARSRQLVASADRAAESVPRMERILRESLAVQTRTLELTRELARIGTETRDTAAQTRDIANATRALTERAARAAESLDRKTGPSLAPASGG